MGERPGRDTAYGRLWWALWDNHGDEAKGEFIEAFAHELAERQRQWLSDQGYVLDCVCDGCSACLAREFIDLIDPRTAGGERAPSP